MRHLSDMALFVEVVKAGGFRGAAEALDMPSSTLSRRIQALEQAVGLRLLHRTTRRIELTEAGRLYFERSRRIVEEARLAHELLGEMAAEPSGVLRVSLPVDFAIAFVADRMPEFCRRFPRIVLELDLTPRRVDLVAEPFDVAVRMGELPSSTLIARKLGEVPRHLYASPRYLDRAGNPQEPADLARHDCLLFPRQENAWTLRRAGRTAEAPVAPSPVRVNNVGMMERLAVAGLGIAMLAKESVAEDLRKGKLRRVLPEWEALPIPVHAVTETRLLPAKTQRFIEYLRACLERTP